MRKKPKDSLPWFKCFQDAWLDGTRDLTPEQRGIYFDCLCLIYKHNTPIRHDDDWVAHQLHVSTRTWRRIRKELISCGKLEHTQDGLVNARAQTELVEREVARMKRSSSAGQRELERRNSPTFPFKNNDRNTTSKARTAVHARASSDLQREEEKKEERRLASPNVHLDDDDGSSETRRVPAFQRKELAELVGSETADELISDYMGSDFARGARVISAAFRGWLAKTHGIHLAKNVGQVLQLTEALQILPRDPVTGVIDTSLPKTVSRNIKWRNPR